MARPKQEQPTPGELEILKILWERGPSTVREVMDVLKKRGRRRAYTSVMSLLNVMADKRLVERTPQGRAFLYEARLPREDALGRMLSDLLGRAFEGSAAALVNHLLDHSRPTTNELDEICRLIDEYRQQQGDSP